MFVYQKNTHFSQAVECGPEIFWESVKDASNKWRIDSRREILETVTRHDEQAIGKWLKDTDFQKFIAKKKSIKRESVRQKFFEKSDEEKLLAFAQELKDNLTAFIFSCREFDETQTSKGVMFRHRRLADCHLNGLVMLDIDHVENPQAIFEKLKADEELMKRVVLVHVTSSMKGIRIVFTADGKIGNLADNQIDFADRLGYKADSSCIDATRNSFCPKEEDILFINEKQLFDYYDSDYDKEYTSQYRERKTQPLYHQFADSGRDDERRSAGSSEDGREEEIPEMKWRGYDLQLIINARYGGKLPCAADSNRHTESLKLATDLLLMLDGDRKLVQRIVESQPWVQEIINERDENVGQTVASAAESIVNKEKRFGGTVPSKAMLDAIEQATGKTFKAITETKTHKSVTLASDDINRYLWIWGEKIEEMAEHYPILKDVCKGLKRNQYPAALFVAGGLLMTLMTRCSYRFYHRPEELRRLNNSTLIIGDPASGKSFATRLYKILASPIVEADKVGKAAVNAYRALMKTKGANKEKPQKPKVIIRVHPARTSNAQFIQDMVNAKEVVDGEEMQLHMLTFDTELDNTLTVQKGGSWIDKQTLQLKAFHNEEDGQSYSNVDSELQDFIVVWNFIYTGTPIALNKMVTPQNFGSGLATRLSCIPLPSTKFKMLSRERTVDYDSDKRLKEWAEKLDKTKGELSVEKIVDELYDWTARRMADAEDNDSEADEMLLKRCAYHGLNFSAPFIVMRHWDELKKDGDFWCGEFETDDIDWRLAELICNIQYACQKFYFGAMADAYFDNKMKEMASKTQHQQKTSEGFNRLPEEFTVDDVMRCFQLDNINSAKVKINRLCKDNLVMKIKDSRGKNVEMSVYKKTNVFYV